MLGLLLLAGVIGLMAAAAFRPPTVSLAVLVGTVVLIPGSLAPPGAPGFFTIHRLVLLAAASGLLRRCLLHQLPWTVWSMPALGYRFVLVVGASAVIGIGLSQPSTDPGASIRSWQAFAVQAVFLIVWVALVRATGDPLQGALAIVVATLVAGGIALLEKATGVSYARLWFHAVPSLLGRDEAQQLALRGGKVRVRAAADFTLAFAWTTAAVLPLLLVLAALYRGRRRVLLLIGLPVLGLAVVFTYSRTVIGPLFVAIVFIAAVLRDRAIRAAATSAAAAALLALLLIPSLASQFTEAVDKGSIDVRVARLPVVGRLAAQHAYTGLGFSGLVSQGISVTDTSYLLTYAELGVIGLALFVALLVGAATVTFWGARTQDPVERRIAVAAGFGVVLMLLGAFTFDTFSAPAAAETFWLLVALGCVAQDGVSSRRRPFPLGARLGLVVTAALVGVALRGLAPTHVAQTWQFETLAVYQATVYAPAFTGTQLLGTVCTTVKDTSGDAPIVCQANGMAPGQGILRLQASTPAALAAETARALAAVHTIPQLDRLRLQSQGPPQRGTPTGLRTAPVWLPVLIGLWVLPVPRGRRRRSPASRSATPRVSR